MPKVEIKDIDHLNAVLTVVIGKEDYLPQFNKELKKLRDTSQFKGFRKGHTPPGFLKKMYGKSLVGKIVMDMLQQNISEALSTQPYTLLGEPIPSKGNLQVDFHADDDAKDYEFNFDVGKAPEFEVAGLDEHTRFDYFIVDIPESSIDEQLLYARKHRGTRTETGDLIDNNDIVHFNAIELDGDDPKTDGWKTSFSILVSNIADEKVRQELLTKKKGDTIRFNIYDLENPQDRNFVKKYLLNFTEADIEAGTETGEMYEATIEVVTRLTPATLDQEFFDSYFGKDQVSSEEEAKEMIRQRLSQPHLRKADNLLFQEIHKRLVDINRDAIPLPDDFLKRWLVFARPEEAYKAIDDYHTFSDDLRWNLIKNKLIRQFQLEVTMTEIEERAFRYVLNRFGPYLPWEEVRNIVQEVTKDEKNINSLANGVLEEKLFHKIKATILLDEKVVTVEELEEKLKALEQEKQKLSRSEVHAQSREEE